MEYADELTSGLNWVIRSGKLYYQTETTVEPDIFKKKGGGTRRDWELFSTATFAGDREDRAELLKIESDIEKEKARILRLLAENEVEINITASQGADSQTLKTFKGLGDGRVKTAWSIQIRGMDNSYEAQRTSWKEYDAESEELWAEIAPFMESVAARLDRWIKWEY